MLMYFAYVYTAVRRSDHCLHRQVLFKQFISNMNNNVIIAAHKENYLRLVFYKCCYIL